MREMVSQLEQVRRNRSVSDSSVRAGELVGRWLESHVVRGVGDVHAIVDSIAKVVDDRFCRYCCVNGLYKGVLTIHVNPSEQVYPMRIAWLFPLKQQLRGDRRTRRVTNIIFQPGREGLSIQSGS